MTVEAKIRLLFKKIDHGSLTNTVQAMKINITTETVGAITYTTMANHISTSVSELPDYLAKNCHISGVKYGGGGQSGVGPHNGIFNTDGSIHIGYHPNWGS